MAAAAVDAYDEEENDVRLDGALVFKPPIEVLPKTKRTEELQKRKIEELKRKKEAAEALRKKKEQEEANRRKEEQAAKKQKQIQEQRRLEQERKRREEEEQRKKMEGGLDQILDTLTRNVSAPHITICGIEELGSVRLRLLTRALEQNVSCLSMDLNRKGLCDEDGISVGEMLEKNGYLQKLECEGNNLGVRAAESIAEALRKNTCLQSLNLESNNLTSNGNDQKGVIRLAEALRENRSLRVLMLCRNGITAQAGEYFVKAIEANEMLTLVDLSGNDPSLSVEQLRRIDAAVQRNRERASAIRRAERRERFALYNEEFKCRQHYMQVEAMRLEVEAHEERRLNRMRARFDRWVEEMEEGIQEEKNTIEELESDAADRAAANASKGKKKKKGK